MFAHPSRVETRYDPVIGIISFRAERLRAWLDDEVYPNNEMSALDVVFHDLSDYPHQPVRTILDQARARGLHVRIERERVLLFGSPGDGDFASDDVALAGACLKAAAHRGEGVVFFLGTSENEKSDFAMALRRGHYDIRWIYPPIYKPPRVPVQPATLVDTVGGAFRARKEVARALAAVGYDVGPARSKETDGRLPTKRAAAEGAGQGRRRRS